MSMPNYQLTPDAQSDLIEIRRHTMKQWGKKQSESYLMGLRKTIQTIAATPAIGKLRIEVNKNVFSFPYSSHVVYYVINNQEIVIFGVLHKRMVPVKHLTNRKIESY